jgi:parallel beta-helix repeat protein
MRRFLLTVAIVLSFGIIAKSQTTMQWDFASDLNGWTSVASCGYSTDFVWASDGGVGAAYFPQPYGNSSAYLKSPSINVLGSSNITLSYNHRWDTESCCDHAYVVYRLDGGSWQQFFPSVGSYSGTDGQYNDPIFGGCGNYTTQLYYGTNNTYTTHSGTINVTGAQTLEVAFVYTSDGSIVYTGWYINTVTVDGLIPPSGFDLAVESIESPTIFAIGNNNLTVKVRNVARDSIFKYDIGYRLDNNQPVVISNHLVQQNDGGTTIDTLYTGEHELFTFPSPLNVTAGTHSLQVWAVDPNDEGSDDESSNDTLSTTFCTGMTGKYVINTTGTGDYLSFNEALNAIQSCGIAGPIEFEVAPGTYNEQVTIPAIPGVSATNTITFRGVSRTNTVLTWGNPNGNTAERHTVILDGADYIHFENMTINSTHVNYATCVLFTRGADYNEIIDCDLNVDSTGTNSYLIVINCSGSTSSYSTGDNSKENLVQGCNIKGGYYNVCWYSTSYSNNVHNQFIENNYSHAYYYGQYQYYCMGNVVKRNRITDMRKNPTSIYYYGYGIYSYYSAADTIDGNIVQPGRYGIYLYRSNYYTPTTSSIVVNNMVSNFGSKLYGYGISCYYCDNTDVYSNTVWMRTPDYTSYSYSYSAMLCQYPYDVDIKNNIFISDGKAFLMTLYVSSTTYQVECDYNLYYWYGGATDYRFYVYSSYFSDFNSFKNYTNYTGTHDQNSLYNVDPGIISREDMHLQPGNEGIEGALLSLDHDVDNNRRCLLQSFLGADEPAWQVSKTDFLADDTMCLNLPITFYNTGNENDPHRASWYLNGTMSSNNFNFTTTITNSSIDTVALEMETCNGIDSVGKIVNIMNPTTVPDIEFVVSKNIVETNELVFVNDMSYQCPDGWEWEITPATYKDVNNIDQPTYAFVNGTSDTSKNIQLVFYKDGPYTVCLTGENMNGTSAKECKPDYINVKFSDNMCGANNRTSQKFGSLYDDGGPSGNYSTYANCTYLISPCSDDVEVEFKELNLASGSFLRLYDGFSSRGIPMWDATQYPNGLTGVMSAEGFDTFLMASQSGAIYVEFESAGSVASGFKFEWTAKGTKTYAAPLASFASEDTGCIVFPFMYENTSSADTSFSAFTWDYDGNGYLDATTVNGEFSTFFPGIMATYNTKLTAENCGGVDTFVKKIILINPQNDPVGDFYADVVSPVANQDIVTFYNPANKMSCVNTWEWIISPNTYYFTNQTNQYSENPQVVFTDPAVCYDVTLVMGNSNVTKTTTLSKTCYIQPKTYCNPIVLNLHQDVGMTRVAIGDIDITSDIGVSAYSNFTNSGSTDLIVGQPYNMTIERPTNFNAMTRKVWIDWNQNGSFTDNGEEVLVEDNATTLSYTGTFTVPTFALTGATVMRVSANYAGFTSDPCGPNKFGEFEDYRVYVSPDNVPPVITIKGNNPAYVEIGHTYVDSGATAVDNIMGQLPDSSIETTNNVNTSQIGLYYVTYEVCDTLGNCSVEQRKVYVTEDMTPPVITLFGGQMIEANVNKAFVDTFFAAYDLADGDLTDQVRITGNLDVNTLGTYTRMYYVEDAQGLSDQETRQIKVVDGAAPDITLKGDNPFYLEISTTYNEPGYTVSDNYWDQSKVVSWTTGALDNTKAGSYTLTYTAKDGSGNEGFVTREIIVWDSMAPMITAIGGDVIEMEVNTQFNDPGLDINDNSAGPFTIVKSGTFYEKYPNGFPTEIGNYIIFYTVYDGSGNKSEILGRVVTVEDIQAPVLKLIGDEFVLKTRWETYTDEGYTLSDNYYDTSVIKVETYSNVDMTRPGIYQVCYTAKDPSKNKTADVCRTVKVVNPTSTSIDENDNQVRIYPNPTTGKFIIEMGEVTENTVITITNLLGETVLDLQGESTQEGLIEVDMSAFATGVYMVRIQSGAKTTIERIVISK